MSRANSGTGIMVKRRPTTLPATVAITSSAVSNPGTFLTAAPHLLNDGDTVIIAGHAGSTPAVAGSYVATVIDATHFSIPVNITVGGTGGTLQRDWQTIGEVTKVTPPGFSRNKIPVSNHNEGREANVLGMLLQKDPAFTINYLSDEQTHMDIENDILLNRKNDWMIALKSGTTYDAAARVQQFNLVDIPMDAAEQADVVITWAEPIVITHPTP